MTSVACVKVGTKYGPEWVNRLEAMVRRHATTLGKFYCLTDNPVGVNATTIAVPSSPGGWWSKLRVFSMDFPEQILYFDLDTVIVRTIDPLLAYRGDFCIMQAFGSHIFNPSVMSIGPGFGRWLWDDYIVRQQAIEAQYVTDEAWITAEVPFPDTWQCIAPGLIGSYRRHSLHESPDPYHVVMFHGTPKNHEAEAVSRWIADHWRVG